MLVLQCYLTEKEENNILSYVQGTNKLRIWKQNYFYNGQLLMLHVYDIKIKIKVLKISEHLYLTQTFLAQSSQ